MTGVGLCLSGGGYRAMLFHLGALWRINELGQLPELTRISSVSGGSITAGALAAAWPRLEFTGGVAANFTDEVVRPVRALAGRTLDVPVILRGLVTPGHSTGEALAAAYRKHLFGDLLLPDLPAHGPHFVFTATDLQDGDQWWFYRERQQDPPVQLATAVAASSAFPPFLSPVVLTTPVPGEDRRIELSDAGVFDNLGLDPVIGHCDTVLVSDAGKRMDKLRSVSRNWPGQLLRTLDIMDNQVRALRTSSLIKSYVDGAFAGAYWGSYSDIDNFELDDALPAPLSRTRALAESPTRLRRTPAVVQERLINWGYAICDAGMRRWVDPKAKPPADFPYPAAGI
ncbi:patatin-like phospholipase family protein [Amycolatopsis methanolica]|uniref:Patatin-like phospholipase n=1 Tax=Amycolatopsis methanolica 239 TaxID=1068978 RepID=A0A076MQZ7_AMYME|nr:patatin-like phospholipase family protein [Amycolatopsis methanolica]AIJ20167.1 patatin-like phospholipase [Amycolatopsis methanolica 239]